MFLFKIKSWIWGTFAGYNWISWQWNISHNNYNDAEYLRLLSLTKNTCHPTVMANMFCEKNIEISLIKEKYSIDHGISWIMYITRLFASSRNLQNPNSVSDKQTLNSKAFQYVQLTKNHHLQDKATSLEEWSCKAQHICNGTIWLVPMDHWNRPVPS